MKRIMFFAIFVVISTFIFSHCSGFVKIKVAEESYDSPDSWSIPHKNNQRQNAVDADIQPPFQILWNKKHRSNVTDHPLTLDKFLLVTFKNGGLSFYDTEIGERIGDGKLVPGAEHSPAIENGILYYTANLGDKTAGAIRLEKMKHLWEKKLPHINASPLLSGDRMIVAAQTGEIFALNKSSGEQLWKYEGDSEIYGNTAADAEHFYFATVKGWMYCLAISSGELIWKKELSANIYSGPTLGDGKVYIGATSGLFYALDTQNGETRWEYNSKKSIYGNAAFADGVVYFGNSGHYLFAMNAAGGRLKWRFKTGGVISHPPAIGKDKLYLGSWDKNLYVLNRQSGKEVYRQTFSRSIKASPIIYRDRLYLNIANDRLYCLANENESFRKGGKK